MFPQLSVTVHVFVKVPASGHDPATKAPDAFTMFVTLASQLSLAAGYNACAAAMPAISLHCNVVFKAPGTVVQVGAVLSISVITWVYIKLMLPQLSVTFQVLV